MSLIIDGSEMQEEYQKMNAGTVVSVDELYRVLNLHAALKISQKIKRLACLALKPTHPT